MYLDIFILVVAIYAIWKGWQNGLLSELVSLLGFFIGLIVACSFYKPLADFFAGNESQAGIIMRIFAFLILWVVVPLVLAGFATVITHITDRLILLSLPNRIGGALVSLLKYILLLALVITVMGYIHILNPERTANSMLYGPLTHVVSLLHII